MSALADPDEARHGMRILVGHLESPAHAEALWDKHHLARDAVYGRMAVLKLAIDEATAKRGKSIFRAFWRDGLASA